MIKSKHNGYTTDGHRTLWKGGGLGGLGLAAGAALGFMTGGMSAALLGGAIGSGFGSGLDARAQAKEQEKAAKRSEALARETAKQQEQELNRQDKKYADVTAMLENNQSLLSGASATSLTGTQGVNKNSLLLGRKKTLGG